MKFVSEYKITDKEGNVYKVGFTRGKTGMVRCFVNGEQVGKAGGGGYDKKGVSAEKFLQSFVKENDDFYGIWDGKINGAVGFEYLLVELGLKKEVIK